VQLSWTKTTGRVSAPWYPDFRAPKPVVTHMRAARSSRHTDTSTLGITESRDHYFRSEQVRVLYQNAILVLGATATLAVVIVIVLWPIVPGVTLLGWLAGYLVVTALRISLVHSYRQNPAQYSTNLWATLYVAGSGLAGGIWGAGAFVFFAPAEPAYMLLLVCLYAVVVAVGAQALGALLPAFLIFSLTMILPLIVRLLTAGGEIYYPLGMLGFLYLVVISGFAYNLNRTIIDSIMLRFENADLVRSLSEQKATAESSRQVAEQANVAKSKFLAAASHDLRQPLHALGLFHDALGPYVTVGGNGIMERMRQSITALSGLFDSLLDISRLDAGVVEVNQEHFFARSVIDRLKQEGLPYAADKGLTLISKAEDVTVYADRIMLERIVRNLVANAIRYTAEGRIEINCYQAGSRVRIDVSDTGPGIATDDLESIFSEYHQLAKPARDRSKGLGLGLSIVRRLCELMGATIEVRSVIGVGSTFSVELPSGNRDLIAQRRTPRAWDLRGATILVIDDEDTILESMGRVVTRWGCHPILAASGSDALTKVRSNGGPPTAIIADYQLRNGETGIDAIRHLRDHLNRPIPAILVTGDTAPERIQEVKRKGLRMLHKPVMPGELRTALNQAIIDQRG
jgi:signal transduction histidine kinase/ActR/RegA family two-component response regulator